MNKQTPLRAIRDIPTTSIPFKVWNRQNLRREDWGFSELEKFPRAMIRVAWLYEVERELGSGNPPYLVAWELSEKKKRKAKLKAHADGTHPLSVSERRALLPEIRLDKNEIKAAADLEKILEKPDMTLAEEEEYRKKDLALDRAKLHKLDRLLISELTAIDTNWKPPIPKEPEPILKSHPYQGLVEKILPYEGTWASGDGYHSTIHPLEIDWTLTETELIEAFRNWLRKGEEHYPFHSNYKRMANESKRGKRKKGGWLAWLRELTIYRISEVGFTRSEGLTMLGIAKVSMANWEHAQARARERIAKHLDEKINWAAYFHHLDGRESSDWQDHFVKPFTL